MVDSVYIVKSTALRAFIDLFNTLKRCCRHIEDVHEEVWCRKNIFWQTYRVFTLTIFSTLWRYVADILKMCMKKFDAEKNIFLTFSMRVVSSKSYLMPSFIIFILGSNGMILAEIFKVLVQDIDRDIQRPMTNTGRDIQSPMTQCWQKHSVLWYDVDRDSVLWHDVDRDIRSPMTLHWQTFRVLWHDTGRDIQSPMTYVDRDIKSPMTLHWQRHSESYDMILTETFRVLWPDNDRDIQSPMTWRWQRQRPMTWHCKGHSESCDITLAETFRVLWHDVDRDIQSPMTWRWQRHSESYDITLAETFRVLWHDVDSDIQSPMTWR